MTNYDIWTVRQFLEEELQAVKQLQTQSKDSERTQLLSNVIKYLEMRLSGEIK